MITKPIENLSSCGRTFLALYPPEEALQEMLELAQSFYRTSADIKALRKVKEEQYHLTFRFFECLCEVERKAFCETIEAKLPVLKAPELAVAGIGGFPHIRKPRVIWLGLEPPSAARSLFALTEEAAEEAGLGREERPLKPHITIARVNYVGKNDYETAALKLKSAYPPRKWNLLQLMDSKLSSSGAVHSPIAVWKLK